MEVEFRWCQTQEVAVLNEPLAFRTEVIFGKMRESSLIETKRDSLAFNVLLANTCHDLRNVDIVSFRTSLDHIS
jgi:hypothetical protein